MAWRYGDGNVGSVSISYFDIYAAGAEALRKGVLIKTTLDRITIGRNSMKAEGAIVRQLSRKRKKRLSCRIETHQNVVQPVSIRR